MSGLNNTVLMLAPSSWPELGGVQTHLGKLNEELIQLGWQTKILIPPKTRPTGKFGLLWLWIWVIYHLPSFLAVNIIHIHDVFLWFWPIWPVVKIVNLIKPTKIKIITTFHGWEGTYPPSWWQKFNKWLAQQASDSTVAVGAFIAKFYPIKPNLIVYGGVDSVNVSISRKPDSNSTWIYLGRLSPDTGLPILLTALSQSSQKFEFWGDGPMSAACRKTGSVLGWVAKPLEKLSHQSILPKGVVAGGYLAVLEALATGQRVVVIADNPLKNAYYELAPFAKYLTIVHTAEELKIELAKNQQNANFSPQINDLQKNYSWHQLAQKYLKLYET